MSYYRDGPYHNPGDDPASFEWANNRLPRPADQQRTASEQSLASGSGLAAILRFLQEDEARQLEIKQQWNNPADPNAGESSQHGPDFLHTAFAAKVRQLADELALRSKRLDSLRANFWVRCNTDDCEQIDHFNLMSGRLFGITIKETWIQTEDGDYDIAAVRATATYCCPRCCIGRDSLGRRQTTTGTVDIERMLAPTTELDGSRPAASSRPSDHESFTPTHTYDEVKTMSVEELMFAHSLYKELRWFVTMPGYANSAVEALTMLANSAPTRNVTTTRRLLEMSPDQAMTELEGLRQQMGLPPLDN